MATRLYTNSSSPTPQKNALIWLILAALCTLVLWQLPPWGYYILYPFSLLATWFHEMGHGLTALLLGGNFHALTLYPNGSGVATHSGPVFLGRIGEALVAAGGPLGPPLAGAVFIVSGRHSNTARVVLFILSAVLLVSALVWAKNSFTLTTILIFAGLIGLIAVQSSVWLATFTIQFLGVQACISTYHQIDYLFMHSANIGERVMLSDTGQMAERLLLPYWFWGGLMALLSILLLIFSLRAAYR